ncbi:MAG: RNA-binding protein [Elusimicrobia bacterium CG1_02_63_36]|nr:MAG: RNA-binding protein [Elusimicrobia bacterium CG1_02_63_36]PIP84231.1 MAG: RNA-binding protein [Elusimicrobia bacterium CG22_combo_CG10-13_8_21_14_all_63_91]PJA17126.1 MAG: RNA-binding protein [Elusimicrobia bacterium CG_4_10_14_0_2_um_filter_63_34]PJB25526.1 MAG: RNA-binding protein [Elusimicrobia bacterium CG_4_9_14_3_um_filter_62_55]
MKELVTFLAKNLVDRPEDVEVTTDEEDGVTQLFLCVADEDKGKVIGKQGKVIKAIRSVLAVAAAKQDRRVMLDLE